MEFVKIFFERLKRLLLKMVLHINKVIPVISYEIFFTWNMLLK